MTGSATHVILVAHGSRAAEANATHVDLCRHLARRSGRAVRPAFLELSEPGIGDAIDAAVDAGASKVVVLPYFLFPGNHTRRDIPALVDQARDRHPGVEVILAPHVGDGDALADLVTARILDLT